MAGLYIHIPFCTAKCAYCDFYSRPDNGEDTGRYVDALIRELRMRRDEVGPITTIYIGGGTPSVLPSGSLVRLVDALPTDGIAEFTIEANPDHVTPQWVELVHSLGIDRVSIGIQSFVDAELAAVGRLHSADTARKALHTLRAGGISHISADLIYGLPGQTIESWQYSLSELISFAPEHLSAYALQYEPGTRLYARMTAGRIVPTDDDTVARMYDMLCHQTARFGYRHYEISNFALDGCDALHNSAYWNLTSYLGLGASAHSFDGERRRYNPSDSRLYTRNILDEGHVCCVIEEESRQSMCNDLIITALRTSRGLDLRLVEKLFGLPRRKRLEKAACPFISKGQIIAEDNTMKIAEQAWMVSDAILRELIEC